MKFIEYRTIGDDYFKLSSVELYDLTDSNSNLEKRMETICTIAGATVNREKSSPGRYSKLLKEAALSTPSRPFEFIPYSFNCSERQFSVSLDNNFLKFCHIESNCNEYSSNEQIITIYTNLRNVLKYKNINSEFNLAPGFIAFKLYIPIFVRDHLMTHTQLSKITTTSRSGIRNWDYWLPEKFILNSPIEKITEQDFIKQGFKSEISRRWPNQCRFITLWIGGWLQDPNGWKNLFLERSALPELWSNWTQTETINVVKIMANLIMTTYPDFWKKYFI